MATMVRPTEKAREVLRQYWGLELPVDLMAIARGLGAEVREEHGLGYSGLFKYEDGHPVIRVNASEPETRRRFTLAHEIGHFQLGHDDKMREDVPSTFSTDNHDPYEVAANQFAAELLMPEEAIRFLVFKKGVSNLFQLAAYAKVSEVAMRYRLKNLGLTST